MDKQCEDSLVPLPPGATASHSVGGALAVPALLPEARLPPATSAALRPSCHLVALNIPANAWSEGE